MNNMEYRRELEEDIMNKIIFYISQDISKEHIDEAKREFDIQLFDNQYSIEETEFNSWFIWEYRINNESIIDLFIKNNVNLNQEELEVLEALNHSYMSIYELKNDNEENLYKDIFTTDIHEINNIKYDMKNKLIMGRVYEIKGKKYMFDDCFVIDVKYLNGIEKSFYNNYEEYKRKNPNITKQEFLKGGYLFLISIVNIIFNVKREDTDNDRLYVYQSDYAVLEYDEVLDKIIEQGVIEFEDSISDQEIYILYRDSSKNDIVGELVISKKKLEIECVVERDRNIAKKFIEKLLGKLVVHMSDQLVTMEDL